MTHNGVFFLILVTLAVVYGADPPVFINSGVAPGTAGCVDSDPKCALWASENECETNSAWMMSHCRRSCQSCQGGQRAWKLRGHIAKNYDNNETTTNYVVRNVEVESLHVDHLILSEDAQTASIHGRMVLTWYDGKLKWDKNEWGIAWLNFYWLQIWTPKLVQRNSAKVSQAAVTWKTLAANYTGQVYMWTEFTIAAACPMDYTRYPADVQQCCFEFDDSRYFVVNFNISENAKKGAKDSSKEAHSSGWELTNVDINSNPYAVQVLQDWSRDPYDLQTTSCEICVTAKRWNTYHSAEIIGPCVATAIVTLTSFLIANYLTQIWMLISSLGLQILALQTLDVKLPPPTSGTPLVVRFYSINLALTCINILIAILLQNLAVCDTTIPPPRCFDALLGFMGRICPCFGAGERDDKENLEGEKTARKLWSPVAGGIRCIIFAIMVVVYILAMLACLRA